MLSMHPPLMLMKKWMTSRKLVGQYPIRNLEAIGNITDAITGIVVLEYKMILSLKPYIVSREMHFSRVVIGKVKSPKKRKNTKFKTKAFPVETLYRVQVN